MEITHQTPIFASPNQSTIVIFHIHIRTAMPNTYSQLYTHVVFAVQGRQNLISPLHREEVHKFIAGIIHHRGHKLLAIFCMPDHTHLLLSVQPSVALSDIVRDIKACSARFINESGWIKGKFSWQGGFGAFTYSRSQIDTVIKYILRQEEHHQKTTFKAEYVKILKNFEVDYDEQYLFHWNEL